MEGHSASHAVLLGLSGTHISGTPKVPVANKAVLDIFEELSGRAVLQIFFFPRKLFFSRNLFKVSAQMVVLPPGQASRCYQTVVAESSLEGG